MINQGRLLAVERVEALKASALHHVEVRFASRPPSDAFAGVPSVESASVEDCHAKLAVRGSFDPLVKQLATYEVVDLNSREPDLEDIFLDYYEADGGREGIGEPNAR